MPKFNCPVEGYEDNFVEMSDSWTRADIRGFSRSTGEEFLNLIRSKIVSIHLRSMNGTIDSSAKVDDKHLDTLEWPVFQWFMCVPQLVVKDVLDLGEAIRQTSLQTSEDTTE